MREIVRKKLKDFYKAISLEKHINDDLYLDALYCQKIDCKNGANNNTYKNESLSNLGDAVLRLAIVEFFYDKNCDKEQIQKNVQKYIQNDNLCKIREKLGIKEYIFNDTNIWNSTNENNRLPWSNHDIFIEAIIGAIYKDLGYDEAKKWIIKIFEVEYVNT